MVVRRVAVSVFRRTVALFKLISLCVVAGLLLAGVMFPMFGGLGLVSNRASAAVMGVSSQLATADVPLMTTIQDMNGNPIAYLYDQYRVPTPSNKISPNVKAAIVAVEDKRFYQHHGVDWQGIGRAAVANGLNKQSSQGASTLTQQYVKNYLAFIAGNNQQAYQSATARTASRKLREIRIALQLEKQLTKDQILTDYLNTVPFGNHAYGIGAAAHTYFNTTPDKLTLAQSATLAGLVNSPSYLDPGSNPDEALKRRNVVLADLADPNGLLKGDAASQHAALQAQKEPLGVVSPLNWPPSGCVGANGSSVTGFFCQYVVDYLNRYAHLSTSVLMRGGYTIKTTLDPKATQAAKNAAEHQVPKTTDGIANVMAVVQPGKDKHRVRALVANRDFGNDASRGQTSYPLPSQITPFGTGSTYKIFTTAAAMERGIVKLGTVIPTPYTYTSHVFKGDPSSNCEAAGPYDRWYCLTNSSKNYPPQMTLQEALASSPNTGFVYLEEKVGVPAAVDMAVRLGLRDSMQSVDQYNIPVKPGGQSDGQWFKDTNSGSFTLGVAPTSTLELANVDATIMSGGTWCPPTPIDQVIDRNGKPVQINEPRCDQAVDPALANSLAQGLSKDVQPGGTAGVAAKAAGWNREAIGKTGTTENNYSAAFVGATPYMAGAVLTYPDGTNPRTICVNPVQLCDSNSGSQIFGGAVPAATWFEAMNVIHQNVPLQPLPPVDPRYQ